jgi:hypothetical protein
LATRVARAISPCIGGERERGSRFNLKFSKSHTNALTFSALRANLMRRISDRHVDRNDRPQLPRVRRIWKPRHELHRIRGRLRGHSTVRAHSTSTSSVRWPRSSSAPRASAWPGQLPPQVRLPAASSPCTIFRLLSVPWVVTTPRAALAVVSVERSRVAAAFLPQHIGGERVSSRWEVAAAAGRPYLGVPGECQITNPLPFL